jgi:hypothetical protein
MNPKTRHRIAEAFKRLPRELRSADGVTPSEAELITVGVIQHIESFNADAVVKEASPRAKQGPRWDLISIVDSDVDVMRCLVRLVSPPATEGGAHDIVTMFERESPDNIRCQFCGDTAHKMFWGADQDRCPYCGKIYDPILAQDSEE